MILLLCGCVLSVRPFSDDFSDLPPDQALRDSLDRLAAVYSFTEWKGLDWSAIADRLELEMDAALESGDQDAIDRVYRKLVAALPDGHVSLLNDDPARDPCPEAAGDLGVVLSDTDEDGVIVVQVDGAEDVAVGDVVLDVGGVAVEAAIEAAPLHCFPVGLATEARRRSAGIRLLGRGAVDEATSLTLSRDGTVFSVTLTAREDGHDVRQQLGIPLPETRIVSRMLSEDVGLVQLGWEDTVLSEVGFRAALDDLYRDGARRLVIDLRGNDGGTDQTAANIAGLLTDREWFYETITMYDRRTEAQATISTVWVEPQEIFWDLPAVALIDERTVSSGEGIAMMLARIGLPVVGFEGTAASFGSAGSTIALPGGWTLSYPAGRSLDADGLIQLDSDHSLQGGVLPSHRIPWTVDNRIAWAADPDGFLFDHAVDVLDQEAR